MSQNENFVETEQRRCAWCDADRGLEVKAGQTHGICPRHKREMLLELWRPDGGDEDGARDDVIQFPGAKPSAPGAEKQDGKTKE